MELERGRQLERSPNRSSPASRTSTNRRGEAEPLDVDPAAAALNRRSFLALSTATALAAAAGCRRPDLRDSPLLHDPGRPGRPSRAGPADLLRHEHPATGRRAAGAGRKPRRPADEDRRQPASTRAALARPTRSRRPSILDLYSPDRVMSDKYPGVMQNGAPRTWDDFDRFARTLADKFAKNQGEGLATS